MKMHVRHIIFFLLALIATDYANTQTANHKEAKVRQEVSQAFESLVEAASDLNFERYIAHFDEADFTGLNADGTVWPSLEAFSATIKPGFESIEKVLDLKFPVVKITVVDPHTAILINEYEQQMLMRSGDTLTVAGGGTQVWSKASGKWLLVSVSASNK